jgi:hypothetical protein
LGLLFNNITKFWAYFLIILKKENIGVAKKRLMILTNFYAKLSSVSLSRHVFIPSQAVSVTIDNMTF